MKNDSIDSLEKLFNNVELYSSLDFYVYNIDGNKVTLDENEVKRLAFMLGFKEKGLQRVALTAK